MTEYRSFIFYHNNTPRWGEVIRLNLPFEMLPKVHVKLGFRHLAKTESEFKMYPYPEAVTVLCRHELESVYVQYVSSTLCLHSQDISKSPYTH